MNFSTILRSAAGRLGFFLCWKIYFANKNAKWTAACGWMRPILKSKVPGNICIVPSTKKKTIDFLLTAKRDKAAAMRFFEKAIHENGFPEKVAMDKSGAHKSAIDLIIEYKNISVIVGQVKYLHNIVEQDHRAIKRITKPMLRFKSFQAAKNVLDGIELMHMIHKGQLNIVGVEKMSFADQFYALAGKIRTT